MKTAFIVDSGPLAAALHPKDNHHRWACEALAQIPPPFVTCEAVLTETWLLLRADVRRREALLELFHGARASGVLHPFHDDVEALHAMMKKYRDVPMSLADACLVRLAEHLNGATVVTLDRDFSIYRRNGRQRIPLLSPFA